MLTALLRRVFGLDAPSRERETLAAGLRMLPTDATTPAWSLGRLPPLVHPAVAAACSEDALAVAALLSDHGIHIDPGCLHDLREFLCDGATSPLFDNDPHAAMAHLAYLRERMEASAGTDWADFGR